MGLAGWSYESHNPPLYYALLVPLHRTSKALGFTGEQQVLILRSGTVLLWLSGCLLLLVLGQELYASFGVPRWFTLMISLAVLLLNHRYVTTLGNDGLGLLVSVGTLLFAARYLRATSGRDLVALVVIGSLAPLAKLTNSPLALMPLATVVWVCARERRLRAPEVVVALSSVVPLALYLGYSRWRFGSVLGSDEARMIFASFIEPIGPFRQFVSVLTADSFSALGSTSWSSEQLAGGLWLLLVLGSMQSLYSLFNQRSPQSALHLVCVASVLAIVGVSWLLNESGRGCSLACISSLLLGLTALDVRPFWHSHFGWLKR